MNFKEVLNYKYEGRNWILVYIENLFLLVMITDIILWIIF